MAVVRNGEVVRMRIECLLFLNLTPPVGGHFDARDFARETPIGTT